MYHTSADQSKFRLQWQVLRTQIILCRLIIAPIHSAIKNLTFKQPDDQQAIIIRIGESWNDLAKVGYQRMLLQMQLS
jgi:hypothetical protein